MLHDHGGYFIMYDDLRWKWYTIQTLHWHHNGRDGASNNRRLGLLLRLLFRRRSKKTSKLRVTGLCEGNPPVTGGFPSQRASNAENASIWWRHHEHTRLSPRHNTSMASDNLMYYFLAMPVWYITLTNISQWWIPDYIHWNLIALLILPIIHRKDNLSF